MNVIEEYIFQQHLGNLNTKWEKFSKEVKSLQTPETFSILYATDIHYIRKYANYIPSYYKVKEMVEFSKYAGFDLLAITGDIVDGNTTIDRQKRDLYDLISLIREAKTTSVLISKGNHDDNSWYAYKNNMGIESVISPEEWYAHVVNPIRVQYPIVLDKDNLAGGYYYIDYPVHKIRVINLNTNDTVCILNKEGKIIKEHCGLWNMGLQEKQLKWLTDALKFDESGWAVMIMSHDFLLKQDISGERLRNGSLAWEIIKAYRDRNKGVVRSDEKYYEAEVHYDFTGNKSNEILPYLYGHIHRDDATIVDGIVAIGTKNMLGKPEMEWDEADLEIEGGWDCILVDRKNRIWQSRRYGIKNAERKIYY